MAADAFGIEVGGPVSRAARPGHGGTALADAERGAPPAGPSPRPNGKRRAAASGPHRPSHGPPQTPGARGGRVSRAGRGSAASATLTPRLAQALGDPRLSLCRAATIRWSIFEA